VQRVVPHPSSYLHIDHILLHKQVFLPTFSRNLTFTEKLMVDKLEKSEALLEARSDLRTA
jgi:hypothetical protein